MPREFQLTRSRGAWPPQGERVALAHSISTHTLTWSVTLAIENVFCYQGISTHTLTWSVTVWINGRLCSEKFQLTRSRGAWLAYMKCWTRTLYFNSHAHVERDSDEVFREMISYISTHTLTWSVTFGLQAPEKLPRISTHTLTWSVTIYCADDRHTDWDFNSHAHVERDQPWRFFHLKCGHFNSHAHVERDSVKGNEHAHTLYFNSHAHVERDFKEIKRYYRNLFQLTRSRGAWRRSSYTLWNLCRFQLTRSRGAWLCSL